MSFEELIKAAVKQAMDEREASAPKAPILRTFSSACEELGISAPTLRDLIAAGCPVVQIGAAGKRVIIADVVEWLRTRGREA
jgi:hypothetical protein